MNVTNAIKTDLHHIKVVDCIPADYHYSRRNVIMTSAERKFFQQLVRVLRDNYYVFPQMYLSTLFEHRVYGQHWWSALQHINRKSVDFVICTKNDLCPVLAIELDDWSHELKHRQERDKEVQRIFHAAGLPLKRLDGKSERDDEYLAVILKNLCLKI